jgi:hypothetical protein
MTPPTQPTRTSAVVRIVEAAGTNLKSLLVCAILFGPGLYWFIDEIQSARAPGEQIHTLHISIAVGLMVAGAIALQPPFGKQLTSIFVTVFPNGLPLLGGRRASDPKPEDTQP